MQVEQNGDSGRFSQVENSSPPKIETSTQNKLKNVGIRATRFLPFSSRSIAINILKTPIRLGQSIISGIGAAVILKRASAFKEAFKISFSDALKKDWKGGISDYYTRVDSLPTEKKEELLDHAKYYYATGQVCTMYLDSTPKKKLDSKTEEKLDSTTEKKRAMMEQGKYPIFPEKGFLNMDTDIIKDSTTTDWASLREKPREVSNETTPTQPEEFIVNNLTKEFEEKLGILPGRNNTFYEPSTGTCFRLTFIGNEVVIGFQGSGSENLASKENARKLEKNAKLSILKSFFGGIDNASLSAMKIGEILKTVCKNHGKIPVVAGFSHGGRLAQCAAAKNGIKGVFFSSEPMGASVRRYIGIDKIHKNSKNMTAFAVQGEGLGGRPIINILSTWIERLLGIPMPRTVAGKAYCLPRSVGTILNPIKGAMIHTHLETDFKRLHESIKKEKEKKAQTTK